MLVIQFSLGVLPLGALLLAAFTAGFLLRSGQLKGARRKVIELEREMLSNHADILDLQKERAQLLRHMKESSIPVIPMKHGKEEADKNDSKSRHAR